MLDQDDWTILWLAGTCIFLGAWAFVISLRLEAQRSKELEALAEEITERTTMSSDEKFQLVCTCDACPEQYYVYLAGKEVGYMRLRWGCFTASCDGFEVYSAESEGEGRFEDCERDHFLNRACHAIKARLEELEARQEGLIFEVVSQDQVSGK